MTIGTVYRAARRDVESLAQWTQDQFSQLAGSIATGWNSQHDGDGGHTNIVASGSCTCQQLRLRGFVTLNLAQVPTAPLDIPAGIAYVTISNISGYNISGLRQVGQQLGDQIFLRVDPASTATAVLVAKAGFSATPQGTEFAFSSFQANGAYPNFNLLAGGGWVPFIYSPGDGTNSQNAWVMHQVVGKP
jgi:hypothetical protein